MRIGVVDMGTNTFNLLVAEVNGFSFSIIYHHSLGVMLGEGGINSGTIAPQAYQRGLQAVDAHMRVAKGLGVEVAKGFATSAIRSAGNGGAFVDEITSRYGLEVEVISGEREAELIYRGVAASMSMGVERTLIMDIGGGSNEFIICNKEGMLWRRSFPLGMSRLQERFKPADPMLADEVEAVEGYLADGLEPLWEACQEYQPKILVGASGAFDTFRSIIGAGNGADGPTCRIGLADFAAMHQRLLCSNLTQRREMEGMDELRAEMIVLASIITTLVLRKANVGQLLQSSYSLKEGAIVELLENAVK
jgi:exopolyphosphatase / guanosine-5'-triphosphate,3'-diphosphate pyrophosphatase